MSLIEKVTETITGALTTDLAEYLADKFGLDSNEVTDTIKDYLGQNTTPSSPVRNIATVSSKSNTKPATTGTKTCQFKITRGPKEGAMCGTTIRGAGDYCSKHKNRKTVQIKTPLKKTSIGNNTNITRDPKAKCWVISGTKYAVKSPRNKTVVGKIVGSKVVPLTKADKKKVDTLNIPLQEEEEEEEEEEEDEIVDDFDDE